MLIGTMFIFKPEPLSLDLFVTGDPKLTLDRWIPRWFNNRVPLGCREEGNSLIRVFVSQTKLENVIQVGQQEKPTVPGPDRSFLRKRGRHILNFI